MVSGKILLESLTKAKTSGLFLCDAFLIISSMPMVAMYID